MGSFEFDKSEENVSHFKTLDNLIQLYIEFVVPYNYNQGNLLLIPPEKPHS